METPPPSSPSDPEPQPTPADGATPEELQRQLRGLQARFDQFRREVAVRSALVEEHAFHLRKLLVGMQVALLFLLFGTCLFMGVQMRAVRGQVAAQRPAMMRAIEQFESRVEPNIKRFAGALQGYAARNPDFQPILERHRGSLSQYFTSVRPTLDVSLPQGTGPAAP